MAELTNLKGVDDTKTEKMSEVSNEDDLLLKKMGYEKQLYRGLGAFSNFAFGFTEVAVLASFTGEFSFGLEAGGPSVIFWGYLVTFIVTMFVSLSMAEICASYPSAGSVYHWSAQVVPAKWAPLASYITGWFNFVGNGAGDASFAFLFAQFLDSAIVLSHGKWYSNQDTVGISIAIIILWTLLNAFRIDKVGWVNTLAAITQISSIIIIIFACLLLPDHLSDSTFVFTAYNNETGFSSKSYVCTLGLLCSLFSFAGYEASAHMAEETEGAARAAPRGIIFTCLATGLGGLAYLLALLYALDDGIDDVLVDDTSTGTVSNLFIKIGGSKWGQGLTWLVVINLFFAGVSSVAVTGRITFALMRDRAFPYSEFWAQVHPTLKSPIHALTFVCIFDCLIQLLPLIPKNGNVAFQSIIAMCTIGFQVSYACPILLKLIFQPADFPITEMNLGAFSIPCGILSVSWLLGTSCFFFFPTEDPITTQNMNWVVVVLGGIGFLCTLYWFFSAKDTFTGPKRTRAAIESKKEAQHGHYELAKISDSNKNEDGKKDTTQEA